MVLVVIDFHSGQLYCGAQGLGPCLVLILVLFLVLCLVLCLALTNLPIPPSPHRDWDGLIDDFVALGFLPAGCDRGLIIPVMDRVLSPYLRCACMNVGCVTWRMGC